MLNAEDKKCARLNVIRHLFSIIPYEDLTPEPMKLPLLDKTRYIRPPTEGQNFVPELYRRQGRDDEIVCPEHTAELRSAGPIRLPSIAPGRLTRAAVPT